MPETRVQFRVLLRSFATRIVDLELIAPGGEMQTLFVQIAAMLAAFNFVLAYMLLPRYTRVYGRATAALSAWHDEEFLIATTMTVAGLMMVFAWDSLLPDRRDCIVLGVLPVRTRIVLAARLTALAGALATAMALVNVFTAPVYPFLIAEGLLGAARAFVAYVIAAGAAGLFVACALLAVQGIAAQVLSYRVFLRVSNFLQLAAFFVLLGAYFLKPALATPARLAAAENQRWLAALPSYWFLGLFHEVNGTSSAVFRPLAARAVTGLLVAATVAFATYVLGYGRNVRRMLEQPDIVPADRQRRFDPLRAVVHGVFRKPLDRAVVLFTARTLARSRQHRLLLAIYSAIGLAIALAYGESLLHGDWRQRWDDLNAPMLAGSFVLFFFVIVGVRAVFSLPFALRSNWVFRVTSIHSPRANFAAVQRALYAVAAAPIWLAAAIFFFGIWPFRPAMAHVAFLVLVGIALVEMSLDGFRKIPFTCSFVPGKQNLKVTLAIYGSVVLFVAHQGAQIEYWAMHRPVRFAVLTTLVALVAAHACWRRAAFARATFTPVQFEERPEGEVFGIDLRRDSELLGAEPYIDASARRPAQ